MARKSTHVRRPDRYITREGAPNPLRDRINNFVEEHQSLALDDSHDRYTLAESLEEFVRILLHEERMYVLKTIQRELDGLK